MSNKNGRRLKGYYGFSKKYPSQRGTVYAIGESKRMRKKELRNKILLTVGAFVLFAVILTFYLFCRELSNKPIPQDVKPNFTGTVSAENIGQIKAVYIENSVLDDSVGLDKKLNEAKENGFNAVMLDFKDEDGSVLFPSAVAVVTAHNEEKAQITETVMNRIKQDGFTVIARIYCFCDSVAPQRTGAFVYEDTERTMPWFDKPAATGGKVWLNPADSRAVNYLVSIIGEAKKFGADCIYLQGVEFPVSSENPPVFTEDDTSLSRNFILLDFIEKATSKAGDCPVIVGFSFDGIDGNSEKWGGTLFDSAAAVCSPEIPVTDDYAKYVGNLWLVLNDRAKNNFTTLKVVPTVKDLPENDGFYEELSACGAESYIIIP